jgi:hypothetical protein
MATMIAKKLKGDFDTYFFVIVITLSNMQMQKDTTDMLQWVVCSHVNYCQSDKKLLGCYFGEPLGTMEVARGIYEAR